MKFVSFFIAIALLSSASAYAFPHSIGHGYTSCTNCHFNPLGGGPLTDYGRAVGATAFAAIPFYVKAATPEERDETLGRQSAFLGSTPLPFWLRPGFTFRELYLIPDLSQTSSSRWITMQAEASLVLRTKKDGLIAAGRLGYIPVPSNPSSSQKAAAKSLISREHYLGARLTRSFGVYAGMMDPAFGLRVPDHSAYLRSKTLLNQNDQTHGLVVHYTGSSWESALHLMTGNLLQTAALRQRGLSGEFEFDSGKQSRLGVSALHTSNEYRSRDLAALHARLGFGEGSALLAQLGLIREAPRSQATSIGGYWFGQYSVPLARGLNLLATTEYYTSNWTISTSRRFRAGPSVQYLPMQRLELRIDALATRSTGSDTLDADIFALQSQVQVWL